MSWFGLLNPSFAGLKSQPRSWALPSAKCPLAAQSRRPPRQTLAHAVPRCVPVPAVPPAQPLPAVSDGSPSPGSALTQTAFISNLLLPSVNLLAKGTLPVHLYVSSPSNLIYHLVYAYML